MWFRLRGDKRLGKCATENCGGQPAFRLEADGVGSDYCSGCRAKINDAQIEAMVKCWKYEPAWPFKLNEYNAVRGATWAVSDGKDRHIATVFELEAADLIVNALNAYPRS